MKGGYLMLNKIKARRFITGKTQDQLFIETGIRQCKISRIENGYLNPSEEERNILAEALGCKPEELFDLN